MADVDTNNVSNISSTFGKTIDVSFLSPTIIEIISGDIAFAKSKIHSIFKGIIKDKIENAENNNNDYDNSDERKLRWILKETKMIWFE